MKFSEQWLREHINTSLTTNDICERLTMAGLELESIEPVCKFTGVVVALVEEVKKHPDANKLSLCQLTDGSEHYQVICGAANVREGLKVALAKVGAKLPNLAIKKAKLRGVESFGMLCSEVELGLAEKAEGIMELPKDAPLGESIESYLKLNDHIIDLSITPNRGDAISIKGVAREIGALTNASPFENKTNPAEVEHTESREICLSSPEQCPKYLGRIIRNINSEAISPSWLKERLRRSGIRSISPVVDVTNYVMLELGQPMHAFDLDKIEGNIHVRLAKQDEELTLLNEEVAKFDNETLLIADDKKPLALAGIMGGLQSGVTDGTRHILLESAFFDPEGISRTVRKYLINSDSSYRFERGVDYNIQEQALERATDLLQTIVGGEVGCIFSKNENKTMPARKEIQLRLERLQKTLGYTIDEAEITQILSALGMQTKTTNNTWLVIPPSYRFDITMEIDLIEEIARVKGYNAIPETLPQVDITNATSVGNALPIRKYRELLTHLDYHEVICYSFVDKEIELKLSDIDKIALLNPISQDLSIMRTTLWGSLLRTLQYNQNRQQERVRIFETGLCYENSRPITQTRKLAGLITGDRLPEQWGQESKQVDFYDIKNDVEQLLEGINGITYVSKQHKALHPGQSAQVLKQGKAIGWIGALHPKHQKDLSLKAPVFLFELDAEEISETKKTQYLTVSKFPEIRRDLAFWCDTILTFDQIINSIKSQKIDILKDVKLFDIYDGEKAPRGKKSYAIALILQHSSRTLVDDEVNTFVDNCVQSLKEDCGAELRD